MKKFYAYVVWFSLLAFTLVACGGGGGESGAGTPAPITPALKVSGTASEGALITGRVVKLKDAYGNPAVETITNTTGGFSIDVANLTAPFLVTVTGTNGTYISLAQTAGTANINPITTMVVALAAGTPDVSALFTGLTPAQLTTINTNYTVKSALVTTSLQAALPSGFTAGSYFTGTVTAGTGMDAMFDTYQIVVHPTNGITVKTNDASATTCLTIPVATVTANTTGPLPTINVPTPTPTPTPIPTPTPTPTPIPTPTPPTTPTGFAVTTASASQINLSWDASTGATSYKIYKSGSYLKTVTTTSTSDTGLTSSTNYCYYVIANNSAGDSLQTSQQCATTTGTTSYSTADLNGTWALIYSSTPSTSFSYTFNQLGQITQNNDPDVKNGTGTIQSNGTVTITLTFFNAGQGGVLYGSMSSDKNSMSGTFTVNGSNAGTWNATKSTVGCSTAVGNWGGTLTGNNVCGIPYTGNWTMTVDTNCVATVHTIYSSGNPGNASFTVTGNSASAAPPCTGCSGTPGSANFSALFSGNAFTGNFTGCGSVDNLTGTRQL
jgi:hypothetical protein